MIPVKTNARNNIQMRSFFSKGGNSVAGITVNYHETALPDFY
jgi:hypothetical protein